MNKQEVIELLHDAAKRACYRTGRRSVHIDKIVELVNEIHEPQKVVVPKFVAELLEEMKQYDRPLYSVMSSLMNKTNHEWTVWKSSNMNFSEIVAQAWIYGYEIEPERLYTVEIPNPNINTHTVLQKTEKGLVLATVGNTGWAEWENSKLTKSEIKKDFDFLWQFAKEVGNDTKM